MTIHFDNEAAAKANLESRGFRLLRNGNWFNPSTLICASVHPVPGQEFVRVFYRDAA